MWRDRETRIKLNTTKTVLFERAVEYLEHKVSEEGISMVPDYVSQILEWPVPENVTELQRALGFQNREDTPKGGHMWKGGGVTQIEGNCWSSEVGPEGDPGAPGNSTRD